MSVATQLMAETAQAQARQSRAESERLDAEEQKRTERQLAIFDRARTLFDHCLALARDAIMARATTTRSVELAPGRFEKSDYDRDLNLWNIVVLALRENEVTANLVWHESEDQDELGGRGRCTVYTPCIEMSWSTKA